MYSIINSIVLVIASVYMFTSDLPVHNDILCSTVVAFQTDVLNYQVAIPQLQPFLVIRISIQGDLETQRRVLKIPMEF